MQTAPHRNEGPWMSSAAISHRPAERRARFHKHWRMLLHHMRLAGGAALDERLQCFARYFS